MDSFGLNPNISLGFTVTAICSGHQYCNTNPSFKPRYTHAMTWFNCYPFLPSWSGAPLYKTSGLAQGQNDRFAREAVTRKNTHPTPSGAVGHNPKNSSGQFLGRASLEMCFLRVVASNKIGLRTRVDAYVCLALHAGRVKRVKRPILGQNRVAPILVEAPSNSPYPNIVLAKK